jgi:hypothetical protein
MQVLRLALAPAHAHVVSYEQEQEQEQGQQGTKTGVWVRQSTPHLTLPNSRDHRLASRFQLDLNLQQVRQPMMAVVLPDIQWTTLIRPIRTVLSLLSLCLYAFLSVVLSLSLSRFQTELSPWSAIPQWLVCSQYACD